MSLASSRAITYAPRRHVPLEQASGRLLQFSGRRRPVHAVPPSFQAFEIWVCKLQDDVIKEAEVVDGSTRQFSRDRWERGNGDGNAGYGITAVLEDGDLLEKAAVNVTVVRGKLSSTRAAAMSARGRLVEAGTQYAAAAMSLVFHPLHPLVPTLRADVRMFKAGGQAWFGGGCDLTPGYLFEEDATDFHAFWRELCGRHGPHLYCEYKAWCDRYFYLPARKEHRGIGGVFFDDLAADEPALDAYKFVQDVGTGIIPSWRAMAERRRVQSYGDDQRQWQLLRRGRYLEFNLLYDRGVRFGLDGGRVESIMVSAPPLVAWRYCVEPQPGSEEARLLDVLRNPREWVDSDSYSAPTHTNDMLEPETQ